MNHLLFNTLLAVLLITRISAADEILIDDPLRGSTKGTQVGGGFQEDGYVPGPGQNHVLYTLPHTVKNGCVEFEMKGMMTSLIPAERTAEQGFLGMYDGRGIQEPAEYFRDFKQNFYRWNVHWRGSTKKFRVVIQCAAPTEERQQATAANFTEKIQRKEDVRIKRDWRKETDGIPFSWDANRWDHLKLEWRDKTYKLIVNDQEIWRESGPYDYAPAEPRIWLGCAPGHDNKYINLIPKLTYRNFKVTEYSDAKTAGAALAPSYDPITRSSIVVDSRFIFAELLMPDQ